MRLRPCLRCRGGRGDPRPSPPMRRRQHASATSSTRERPGARRAPPSNAPEPRPPISPARARARPADAAGSPLRSRAFRAPRRPMSCSPVLVDASSVLFCGDPRYDRAADARSTPMGDRRMDAGRLQQSCRTLGVKRRRSESLGPYWLGCTRRTAAYTKWAAPCAGLAGPCPRWAHPFRARASALPAPVRPRLSSFLFLLVVCRLRDQPERCLLRQHHPDRAWSGWHRRPRWAKAERSRHERLRARHRGSRRQER
jgi:hypothetical protein